MAKLLATLVASVWVLAWGSAAQAQVIISGSYYEEPKDGQCDGGSQTAKYCQFFFSAVPAIVDITRVSCRIVTPVPITFFDLEVTNNSDVITRNTYITAEPIANVGGNLYYSINQEVLFRIGSGRYPRMEFSVSGTAYPTYARCLITGKLNPA